LTFLPGLALWFSAWDNDQWLKAHGRSAAKFQMAILAGYIFIAVAVTSADETFQVHGVILQLTNDFHKHRLISLVWLMVGHLGFILLVMASIFFSLRSAWRAIRGLAPRNGWNL
jgi:uncharacterized Tic20 family protein